MDVSEGPEQQRGSLCWGLRSILSAETLPVFAAGQCAQTLPSGILTMTMTESAASSVACERVHG